MKTMSTTNERSSKIFGPDLIKDVIALLRLPFLATSLIGLSRRMTRRILKVDVEASIMNRADSTHELITMKKSRQFHGERR